MDKVAMKVKLFLAGIGMLAVLLLSDCANAATEADVGRLPADMQRSCLLKESVKSWLVGGAYGAGIGIVGGGLVVMMAPAGAIAAPAALVIGEGVYGGLLGTGAAAITQAYTEVKTGQTPFSMYCARKTVAALPRALKMRAEEAAAAVHKAGLKTQRAVKHAWNSPMPA